MGESICVDVSDRIRCIRVSVGVSMLEYYDDQ